MHVLTASAAREIFRKQYATHPLHKKVEDPCPIHTFVVVLTGAVQGQVGTVSAGRLASRATLRPARRPAGRQTSGERGARLAGGRRGRFADRRPPVRRRLVVAKRIRRAGRAVHARLAHRHASGTALAHLRITHKRFKRVLGESRAGRALARSLTRTRCARSV